MVTSNTKTIEQVNIGNSALEAQEAEAEHKLSSKKGKQNKELGRRGEEAAARYLYRRGYEIVERNWKCAFGEADIIARDSDAIVFVEVKTRRGIERGFPSEAVGKDKRARYEKIALTFLKDYDINNIAIRFDVVAIVSMGDGRALIRHHINAFSAE